MIQIMGVLLLALFWSASIQAGTLHVLLVIDTEAESIGKAMECNGIEMQRFVRRVTQNTSLELNETLLIGNDITAKKIRRAISKWHLNLDDAVLFYFCGHGFRTTSKGDDPWPYLLLSSENNTIDYATILSELLDKNPRFLFATADCCNSFLPDFSASKSLTKKQHALYGHDFHIRRNYSRLFEEADALILICSSIPGEPSWCQPSYGSLYTLAFLESLFDEVEQSPYAQWEVLLEKTKQKVLFKQTPLLWYIPNLLQNSVFDKEKSFGLRRS